MSEVPIFKKWEEYREKVMHPASPAGQRRECRRAFFAGASALLGLLLQEVDDMNSDVLTPATIEMLKDIAAELQSFRVMVQMNID